ncbi:MAG TPA: TIGR00266 family protein [Trichormus sp.]|jgi:uncharacterized protein (TIGR00266 family)
MKYEIQHNGTSSVLQIELDKGEAFKAAAGTLMGKSSTIDLEGTVEGGAVAALKRSLLGGGSLFFQTLTATESGAGALIAPALPGEIKILDIADADGGGAYLQGHAFLATLGEVTLNTEMQVAPAGLLTGEGLFVLHATGSGALAVSAFGDLHYIKIAAGSDYLVDNGHLVAWRCGHSFTVEKSSSSWISSFVSGEGLLWRFQGPAELWLQTRNPHAFSHWMKHMIPTS